MCDKYAKKQKFQKGDKYFFTPLCIYNVLRWSKKMVKFNEQWMSCGWLGIYKYEELKMSQRCMQ